MPSSRSSRITIRIMWTDNRKKAKARRIARIIEEALKNNGIKYKVSREVPNRTKGARIYISVE